MSVAPPMRRRIQRADIACGVGCLLVAGLSCFPIVLGNRSAVFEFVAWVVCGLQVLRVPVGFALLVAAAVVAIARRRWRRPAVWLAAFGFVAALPEARGHFGTASTAMPSTDPTAPTIRILTQNIRRGCSDPATLVAEIDRLSADVVCLQEYPADGHARLAPLLAARYPHSLVATTTFVRGTAIYSRFPIDREQSQSFEASDRSGPWISARLLVGDRAVRLYCLHLSQPKRLGSFRRQRAELRVLLDELELQRAANEPTIVAGDFNAPPETYVDELLRDAGLSNAAHAVGAGTLRTWPTCTEVPWFRLFALDHVYLGSGLSAAHVEVARYGASDHRGLVADLTLSAQSKP
ncbi:MAG: endonuclease/exonuclease/phosphatase family protein [Phycisphaerales bacterium]|nr:endonuclease/exonuclease/phosphatase family protein [Phycisphaerales bacterium]